MDLHITKPKTDRPVLKPKTTYKKPVSSGHSNAVLAMTLGAGVQKTDDPLKRGRGGSFVGSILP